MDDALTLGEIRRELQRLTAMAGSAEHLTLGVPRLEDRRKAESA